MASATIRIGEIIQIRKNYRLIEKEYSVKYEVYSEYRDFVEKSKKFRHDLANHLSVLSSSLHESENSTELVVLKQNTEELIKETKKLKIFEYRSVPSIINALFTIKEHSAEEKNIDLKYQITLSDKLFISDYDLVGILSNLLDNAIEACDKVPAAEKEIILKMFNRNGYLCIDITNTFDSKNNPVKNNFRTTKDNNLEHGFGSHIIASIVKKYNGYINITNTDEKITINIALNNS
ncbi:MAG: ATP-binding protein [Lachnospiraceae bacterium]|nr:ATP-binding protein [Lachnospiraceae bacterium]